MSDRLHDKLLPGESPEYRDARDRLLAAELELIEQVERVAAMRRAWRQLVSALRVC